jgi:hypothetical protein
MGEGSDPLLSDSDPTAVVQSFIVAMHEWELSAAAAMKAAKHAGESMFDPKYGIRAGQDAVFAQFCTPPVWSEWIVPNAS